MYITGQRLPVNLDIPEVYPLCNIDEVCSSLKELNFAKNAPQTEDKIGRLINYLKDNQYSLSLIYKSYRTNQLIPKHTENVFVDSLLSDIENLYYFAKRRLNDYIYWFILKHDERYQHHKWKRFPYESPTILNVFGLEGNYPEWVIRGDVNYRYNPLKYCSLTGTVSELPAVTECVLHKHKNGDVTLKRMNGTYTSDEVTIKKGVEKMRKAIIKYYTNVKKWNTEDYKGYKDTKFPNGHARQERIVNKDRYIAEHAISALKEVLIALSPYMVDAKLNAQLSGSKYQSNDLRRNELNAQHTAKQIKELYEKIDETLNLCALFNRVHYQETITREELAQIYKHSSSTFANERYKELMNLDHDRYWCYTLKKTA